MNNHGDAQEKADLEKSVAADHRGSLLRSRWWSWGHSTIAVLAVLASFVGGLFAFGDVATIATATAIGAAIAAIGFVFLNYWRFRDKGRHWRMVEVEYRNLLDDIKDPDVRTEEEIELLQDRQSCVETACGRGVAHVRRITMGHH
jgi:type VI protein secretion system component VasK